MKQETLEQKILRVRRAYAYLKYYSPSAVVAGLMVCDGRTCHAPGKKTCGPATWLATIRLSSEMLCEFGTGASAEDALGDMAKDIAALARVAVGDPSRSKAGRDCLAVLAGEMG